MYKYISVNLFDKIRPTHFNNFAPHGLWTDDLCYLQRMKKWNFLIICDFFVCSLSFLILYTICLLLVNPNFHQNRILKNQKTNKNDSYVHNCIPAYRSHSVTKQTYVHNCTVYTNLGPHHKTGMCSINLFAPRAEKMQEPWYMHGSCSLGRLQNTFYSNNSSLDDDTFLLYKWLWPAIVLYRTRKYYALTPRK